jgi:hypothetical protein
VGVIFSFPAHPQTNGHIEGHFGRFSQVVGEIAIDDTSRETIAHSVVEVISNVFDYFHNNSPVKSLGGLTRREYLKRYSPTPDEVEEARRKLLRRQARSRALREETSRVDDPVFRSLVKAAIEDNRLEVDFTVALKSLAFYDNHVIESASRALFAYSKRDRFDEKKRTFAYFMGIVKNKQKETDAARKRKIYDRQKTRRLMEELSADAKKVSEENAQEREDLSQHPEEVILEYSKIFLSGGLRFMRRVCTAKIREALSSLSRLGRGHMRVIENLCLTIKSWGEFSEELKANMVDLLVAEFRSMQAQSAG